MNMPHAPNIGIKTMKNTKRPGPPCSRPPNLIRKVLVLLVLCTGLAFGANLAYHRLCQSDFFQITAVRIDGNRMTSKEQITALSRVDIHSNLLAINVPQVQALLESHPWIATAEVRRIWPNRLQINVREKTPVALLNRETGPFYLDGQGRLIAAAGPGQELDYPVVTGLENFSFNTGAQNLTPDPLQDVLGLLSLANRNNPILPQQNISEIHIAEKGALILYLLDRAFPIYLGSAGKISTRYYRLVKVLKDLYKTGEFSEVAFIRLDYLQDAILVGKADTPATSRKNGKGAS